jgi:hypothetical protein
MTTLASGTSIEEILGPDADALLTHECKGIPKSSLHVPGPDFVNRVVSATDRPIPVLRNLQQMFNTGRLAGTGYLSILPVDQGIEHSAGASFAPNPVYFDPEKIVELAYEGGCNAVASTLGVLGAVARKWAHKIPFMLKFNHNELLTLPNVHQQDRFGSIRQAFEMGAPPSARRSTSAPTTRASRSSTSPRCSPRPTSWAWSPSSGATSATAPSRPGRRRLPHLGRPHRPGQPPRRHHPGRHHQAEAPHQTAGTTPSTWATPPTASSTRRSTPSSRLRRERRQGRPPHRPLPLPGRQLLHGPQPPASTRAALGRQRPAGRRHHRRHQQARRRHGPHLRPQGLPEAR